ncbi:MAG: glutamate--tRNA ligase [Bacteroidetes bacterium]|nr:glutamate--tRNA ligase [Bacteroidota bacterium]
MTKQQIRVRFAPSPTGPLHIGGVRTALYNYLIAKQFGGTMILRIEDTDQNRYINGAEEYIVKSLEWCGLIFDESPDKGGPYAPYRQSERSAIYHEYVQRLIANGHAYYAFDTEAELDAVREKYKTVDRKVFQYDHQTRKLLKNALVLPSDEIQNLLSDGAPYVIRIRIPEDETVRVQDVIRGEVVVQTANLDDKVLFKSDGLPTYHLANVVDDYLMKITHVIRGEEWLPSAPLHVLLYRFLGLESFMPRFAHLPLILKPDGNGKLSKRDGDRLGFPVFPIEWKDSKSGEIYAGYREAGYLPEAVINILAHLGWNPGNEQELFSMEELIQNFSLDRVGKHGSKFDPEKAKWFNHQYMQKCSETELAVLMNPAMAIHQVSPNSDYLEKVIALIKDRVFLVPDLWNNSWFFFQRPTEFDKQVYKKIWQANTTAAIQAFLVEVEKITIFTKDTLHTLVQEFTTQSGMKTGQLMNPVRLLIVGSNQGPGMMDIADMLGKAEFMERIRIGLEKLKKLDT